MKERIKERMRWIETCIRMVGSLDRVRFKKAFAISDAQVTMDFQEFQYQLKSRGFQVRIDRNKVIGDLPQDPVFPPNYGIDWFSKAYPDSYKTVASSDIAPVPENILRSFFAAYRNEVAIDVLYHSATSGPKKRALSPHAFVSTIGRIHARCYDHLKNGYYDFVLGRVLDVLGESSAPYRGPENDRDWRQISHLQLSAAQHAENNIRRAIELAYGIPEGGHREISISRALAPYYIQSLGLTPAGYKEQVIIRGDFNSIRCAKNAQHHLP